MVIDGYEKKDSEKIRLVLRADGSCSIGWVDHTLVFEEYTGLWSVRHESDDIRKTPITFRIPGSFTDGRHDVARDNDELVIWTYWSDPDAGALQTYYKR